MRQLATLTLLLALGLAPLPAATITQLQAPVTKTAAFNGPTFDVSAATGDFTVFLMVSDLTGTARFCLQDVAAADFTTPNYAWCIQLTGAVVAGASKTYSIRSSSLQDTVALAWGKSTGKLRLSLVRIAGTNATVSYTAWLEQ